MQSIPCIDVFTRLKLWHFTLDVQAKNMVHVILGTRIHFKRPGTSRSLSLLGLVSVHDSILTSVVIGFMSCRDRIQDMIGDKTGKSDAVVAVRKS